MTDQSKTLIVALLDRTGSMAQIKTDAEGRFATFIQEQRDSQAQVGDEIFVTLYQFDREQGQPLLQVVCESKPIADVPKYTIEPRGITPLHDAIGVSIKRVGDELASLDEDKRPGKVIFVIMTDGYENASREWTPESVRELVKRQEDEWNWSFVFLGAGIDAFAVGQTYGFKRENTISVAATGEGVTRGYAQASASVAHLRAQR